MSKKQDAYYFNNFTECAEYSAQAARLLGEIVNNFDESKLYDYSEQMHKIEHAADMKKHELIENLAKAFITPIDREDIVEVSQTIDEMTDKIEDVLIRFYCNHVTSIRPDAIKLVDIVIKCCDELSAMLKEFADFKHSKELKKHIINLNSLEEDADKLYIACMHDLHGSGADVMEVIAWRDIYTFLEKCSDTAEHIADIVESVVMKNS